MCSEKRGGGGLVMAQAARKHMKQNHAVQASAQETLQGTVVRRRFYNAENGYCVLVVDANNESVTVVGNMPSVREGDEYKFAGNWVEHPTFGKQLKFTSAELILPTAHVCLAFHGYQYPDIRGN